MQKYILIIRPLLNSCLAEFNRLRKGKVRSFETFEDFKYKAAENPNPNKRLKVLFDTLIVRMVEMMNQLAKMGKPVVVVSYDDMRHNLPAQLLRIVHFIGSDRDSEVVDRLFCTVKSQQEVAAHLRRAYKLDLVPTALEILGQNYVDNATHAVAQLAHNLGFIWVDHT